jgi:leucine efflux protein
LRQAFIVTLLNPKAIVSYLAILPIFIDPATHRGAATIMAPALTTAVLTALYGLRLCAFAQGVSRHVRAHQGLARSLRRVAGVFPNGFGLRIVRD